MAKCCRRRRKMCKTRCRTKCGRFKRCRHGDRRYRVRQRCCRKRRRSCRRRRSRCRRRPRYPGTWPYPRSGIKCDCKRCRRRSRRRRSRPRYLWRCRSRSGSFKRCRHCDRRYPIRRRSS